MAIKRVKSRRRRRSTLVANPRRRVRRARRSNPRRRRRKTATRRNPTRRRVARRRNPTRRSVARRRNPTRRSVARRSVARRRNGGMVIAGVPVVDMAIGSLGSLVVINTLKNLGPVKDQLAKVTNPTLRAALIPGLGAGASFLAYKYGKGRVKKIAQYAFIGCVFKLIDDVTDTYFADEFPKMFSTGTSGVYMGSGKIQNPSSRHYALAGAHVDLNGRMYSQKPSRSAGLYGIS